MRWLTWVTAAPLLLGAGIADTAPATGGRGPLPGLAWTTPLPGPPPHSGQHGVKVGPAGAGFVAVVAPVHDERGSLLKTVVRVLRLADGGLGWSAEFTGPVQSVADAERLYVHGTAAGESRRAVTAFKWGNAERVWTAPAGQAWSGLLAGNGLVLWNDIDRRIVAARATTGEKLWYHGEPMERPDELLALVQQRVYLAAHGLDHYQWEKYGQAVHVLNVHNGHLEKETGFNPTPAVGYNLVRLVWSPRHRRLYGREADVGVGYERHSLRVTDPGLEKFVDRPGVADFVVTEGAVVGEAAWATGADENGYGREGLIGLHPMNLRVMWRKGSRRYSDPYARATVIGEWEGMVVVSCSWEVARTRRQALAGLDPQTGRERWRLDGPIRDAACRGRHLLVVRPPTEAGTAARVEAYVAQR
jgi:hypothetical protein